MKKSSFGLVDSPLLAKIDALFACNAGDYVDLPQLVVVGHQSSGKSSVLEGLTGLPFPRDSGLCTRFATQIVFRRSPVSSIAASIIAAKGATKEHEDKAQAWGKRELQDLDAELFRKLMVEVIDVMGVGPADGTARSAFSKDVLVLEIAGPSQEHFSVIDVPGTFKRTTQGLTTKDDIKLVDEMVLGYMKNPRSVMLTVVPCNADIATQEIVEWAEEFDKEGDRTLGILTKPDLVDKGAENTIVELIEDKRHRLKLGWHLLRNPGQAELLSASMTRNAVEEAFFDSTFPWNDLDKDKVGVESLRLRLQEILAGHIRREFPKVKAEIAQRLQAAQKSLKSLGPKRQTQAELFQFLVDVSLQFQDIASSATRADYRQAKFFAEHPNVCLATEAVNRGLTFAACMDQFAHDYSFDDSHGEEGVAEPEREINEPEIASDESEAQEETVTIRHFPNHVDILDSMDQKPSIDAPRDDDILMWLKTLHTRSRGFELGTFSSSILVVAMQQQARKWRDVARGYIGDMISLVDSFIRALLEHVVPNQHVRDRILSLLAEELRVRYRSSLHQAEFLLEVELEGTPATYNHYSNDNLDKCRHKRLKTQLADKVTKDIRGKPGYVHLDEFVKAHPLSNDEHVIQEIHDILRAYYKVARKQFVDCVRMQAAEYYLITGPNTPLKLFSPAFVASLTATQLEDVAGEEFGVKRRRAELEKKIKLLGEGMKILQ